MKQRKQTRWFFGLLLLLTLLVGAGSAALAAEPADMPGGWSYGAVRAALDNGLLIGGPDGLIRPGEALKRDEFSAMMVRAFGAAERADLSRFSDVSPDTWYYDDMSASVAAGWFRGDGEGHLMPEVNCSRETVFTVTARALHLPDRDVAVLERFSDGDAVAAWAKGPIAALVEAGLVNGSDGALLAQSEITREQTCQLFDNAFDVYIGEPGEYTGLHGSVLVRCDGVTIRDSELTRLCVGAGVEESVTLTNTECETVLGNSEAIIETAPETPAPALDDDPNPATTPTLADALAHFEAHRDNVTVRTLSVTDNGRGWHVEESALNVLDGALEKVVFNAGSGTESECMIDWSRGAVASAFRDGIQSYESSNGMRAVSVSNLRAAEVDDTWFEARSDGVYDAGSAHLRDAISALWISEPVTMTVSALSVTMRDGVIAELRAQFGRSGDALTRDVTYAFSGYGESDLVFPETGYWLYTVDEL